ncbi:MAG: hypothetical protein PF904_06405 [Kiritimatiellae bacterium]|jgi:tetratricopeptide (TPR) repeat protein|nr:hypothetical protein [Kiritimatiellia bacterium]
MKSLYNSCFDNSERIRILQISVGLFVIVCLQWGLTSAKIDLPQKKGNSLMSLISDDTRNVISSSMMDKVESYFHGGVKVDNCSLDDAIEHVMHDGEESHGEENEQAHHEVALTLFNPVLWVNSKIHAQEHHHLVPKRSVELLPWIVAASRASPHNIQSYQIGSYILNRMVGKSQIAIDFLQEGIKNNPASFELEVSLAEIFFNTRKDKERARESFEIALVKCQALGRELSDDEVFVEMKIYFYLGLIAKERGDTNRLRTIFQMALKANPNNTVTYSLTGWLAELESKK